MSDSLHSSAYINYLDTYKSRLSAASDNLFPAAMAYCTLHSERPFYVTGPVANDNKIEIRVTPTHSLAPDRLALDPTLHFRRRNFRSRNV
ncbi:hypothetical protein EVAR_88815_1 [Eumeta japonica]|uniref:Uncharacterized protein n=1 Tax=Eumeta variegata TaxID=151549 RepID=A0A4C1YKN8_EUMVA|nr:hypothetical protein EVAR_88815_1 [Eumeta japonica]